MTNVLIRAKEKKKQRRRPCEEGDRDWSDVVKSQSSKGYQKPLEVRK